MHPVSSTASPATWIDHVLAEHNVLLFDLDGVLRVCTVPDQPCPNKPSEQAAVPEMMELLRLALAHKRQVAIVTNQGGIGLGFLSAGDHLACVRALLGEVPMTAFTADIEPGAVLLLTCPHAPDEGCACRKPQPGLLRTALEVFTGESSAAGVQGSGARVAMFGDQRTDQEAAIAAGFVRSFYQVAARLEDGVAVLHTVARCSPPDAPVMEVIFDLRGYYGKSTEPAEPEPVAVPHRSIESAAGMWEGQAWAASALRAVLDGEVWDTNGAHPDLREQFRRIERNAQATVDASAAAQPVSPHCEHLRLTADVTVERMTQGDDDQVVGWMVQMRLVCAVCCEPFTFLGPVGLSLGQPMASLDGLALRIPVTPQSARGAMIDLLESASGRPGPGDA